MRDESGTPPFLFDNSSSGISRACSLTESTEEAEYFFEVFHQEIMDLIVTETNQYYQFCRENGPDPSLCS